MLMAPADSPNSVTLPGSPPNAAMFSWTQSQRGDLIAQTPVPPSGVAVADEIGMGQEAEGTQAVVDGHDDDALGGQTITGEQRARTRPGGEPAPVQPHQDRPPAVVEARCPDVEIQAVLVATRWGHGGS